MDIKTLKPPPLEDFKARREPLRNIYKVWSERSAKRDRVAVFVTEQIGSPGFFLIIAVWTILWLGWNLLAPQKLRFDPPMGFVFWLFISNLIQLLLMPLIMVGQNVQGRQAEDRAQFNLEINVKAEKEIEVVLGHLEYQNRILIKMLEKMEGKLDEISDTADSE